MSLLSSLYSEVVLGHYKEPHNFGELEGADIKAKGFNRSCGDDVQIFVKLNEGVIKDVRFVGRGCAISQSSASVMTDRMVGKLLEEAKEFVEEFRKLITGEKEFPDSAEFEELVSFKGVKKYPIRVRCASLAWDTLKEGIASYEAQRNGHAGLT